MGGHSPLPARLASLRRFLTVDVLLSVALFFGTYHSLKPYLNPHLESLRGQIKFYPDEGVVLHHAARILQGEMLYRDFFYFQGLIGYLPFTIGFSVATPGAVTGRLVMHTVIAAWTVVTYLLVKEVTQKRWAAALVA